MLFIVLLPTNMSNTVMLYYQDQSFLYTTGTIPANLMYYYLTIYQIVCANHPIIGRAEERRKKTS